MPNPAPVHVPPPENGPLAALLSYLVPGLGQIYQGRIGKGILFFICVYTLFFYGMYLGNWRNVYIVKDTGGPEALWGLIPNHGWVRRVFDHPQFAGQFFVGVVAWPAIYQGWAYDEKQDSRDENPPEHGSPPLGGLMRQPSMDDLETLTRNSDKTWDLAWVCTVIAGVLNVMVIYDAFAGPAFVVRPGRREEQSAAPAASATPAH